MSVNLSSKEGIYFLVSRFFIFSHIFNEGLAFGFFFYQLVLSKKLRIPEVQVRLSHRSLTSKKNPTTKPTRHTTPPHIPLPNCKVKITQKELHTSWVSIICGTEILKIELSGGMTRRDHSNPLCSHTVTFPCSGRNSSKSSTSAAPSFITEVPRI